MLIFVNPNICSIRWRETEKRKTSVSIQKTWQAEKLPADVSIWMIGRSLAGTHRKIYLSCLNKNNYITAAKTTKPVVKRRNNMKFSLWLLIALLGRTFLFLCTSSNRKCIRWFLVHAFIYQLSVGRAVHVALYKQFAVIIGVMIIETGDCDLRLFT